MEKCLAPQIASRKPTETKHMSDTNTPTASAAQTDIIRPVVKKDENGNIVASLTPTVLTVMRGECKGIAYPAIVVTKDNFTEYLKLRGEAFVLDKLNAVEAMAGQTSLDKVLDADEDWVETGKNKAGKPVFSYIKEKFLAVLDKFYDALTSGKVASSETIADLEEEQETIVADMTAMMTAAVKPENAGKAKQMFEEAAVLSAKYQELTQRIADIRATRTPRKTKAQKAAEEAAKAAAAAPKAA